MRKLAVAAAACGLFAAAFGTSSAAAPGSFETQVDVVTANKAPGGFIVAGVLESDKNKCRKDRDVTAISKAGPKRAQHGTTVILDTGTSTDNGGWVSKIEQKFAGQLKINVAAKTLSNGDVCKSKSEPVNL
jgi:hypothetical protein